MLFISTQPGNVYTFKMCKSGCPGSTFPGTSGCLFSYNTAFLITDCFLGIQQFFRLSACFFGHRPYYLYCRLRNERINFYKNRPYICIIYHNIKETENKKDKTGVLFRKTCTVNETQRGVKRIFVFRSAVALTYYAAMLPDS